MSKILKVIKPFFIMENGDTFELSSDGSEYVSEFNMNRYESDDEDSSVTEHYSSKYSISPEYAKLLIEDGFLAEENEKSSQKFVNVFDEINSMLETYREDLDTLDEDMANQPACLKIEKETVLNNLITTLEYLNSLRK